MRKRWEVPFVAALVAIQLVVGATAAAAAAGTRIQVRTQPPAKAGLESRIAATLTTEAGSPVTGAEVSFGAVVELLGGRTALLGTAITDATGTAAVPFTPRTAEYRIVATFGGDEQHAGTQVEQRLTFPPDTVMPYAHLHGHHQLLAPVREVMPGAIGLVVVLLWLGLLVLARRTVRTIRGTAPAPRLREALEEVRP